MGEKVKRLTTEVNTIYGEFKTANLGVRQLCLCPLSSAISCFTQCSDLFSLFHFPGKYFYPEKASFIQLPGLSQSADVRSNDSDDHLPMATLENQQ